MMPLMKNIRVLTLLVFSPLLCQASDSQVYYFTNRMAVTDRPKTHTHKMKNRTSRIELEQLVNSKDLEPNARCTTKECTEMFENNGDKNCVVCPECFFIFCRHCVRSRPN